jgi:hypothetical protein
VIVGAAAERQDVRRTLEMDSQGTDKNSRVSRMNVRSNLRIAVPFILIGGALGALIGSAFGDIKNGIRVGVVLGGVGAFVFMQRKKRSAS